jgi:hypothetical protein
MSRQLSSREKLLSYSFGGAIFLVLNLFLFNFFFNNHAKLQKDLARKAAQLKSMQMLLASASDWEKRDAWLQSKQPVLENEAAAGVQLLKRVQDTAREQAVTVESPVLGGTTREPHYTAVSVDIETKSTWKALISYLSALQSPEQFMVLESANLRRDSNDETQMRGKFRIARWYAPK